MQCVRGSSSVGSCPCDRRITFPVSSTMRPRFILPPFTLYSSMSTIHFFSLLGNSCVSGNSLVHSEIKHSQIFSKDFSASVGSKLGKPRLPNSYIYIYTHLFIHLFAHVYVDPSFKVNARSLSLTPSEGGNFHSVAGYRRASSTFSLGRMLYRPSLHISCMFDMYIYVNQIEYLYTHIYIYIYESNRIYL